MRAVVAFPRGKSQQRYVPFACDARDGTNLGRVDMLRSTVAFAFLLPLLAIQPSGAAETIKIAFIDPLSGPFANVGEMEVRAFQYSIDLIKCARRGSERYETRAADL